MRLIADASGLNERYVREWLSGMTSAGFVDYHPGSGTYLLRPEFVPVVTGAGTENLARTLQYVPLMGEVAPEDRPRVPDGRRNKLRGLPAIPSHHGF